MQQSPIIMVIRHCEKPTDTHKGIRTNGSESEHSLIVRGWQRAGALVPFFAPEGGGVANPALARPGFLFATCPDAEGADASDQSRREEETLSALSEKLAVHLNLGFGKGQEGEIAKAAIACNGAVLIAWDHNRIVELAKAIAPQQPIPGQWPGERFDMIFVFRLQPDGSYEFSQVPQLLLAGDTNQPIA